MYASIDPVLSLKIIKTGVRVAGYSMFKLTLKVLVTTVDALRHF